MNKTHRRLSLVAAVLACAAAGWIYVNFFLPIVSFDLQRGIRAIGISGDGKLAISALYGEVVFLSVSAEAIRENNRQEMHSGPFRQALAISPVAPLAVVGMADRDPVDWTNLFVFDLRDGTLQKRLRSHDGCVTAMAFSDDGSVLLTAGVDGTDDFGRQGEILFWDTNSWEMNRPKLDLGTTAWCIAADRDGSRFAIGDQFGQIELWSVEATSPESSPSLLQKLHRNGQLFDLDFSSDGSLLACAGWFGIDVIDVASHESVLRDPEPAVSYSVRFVGDGNNRIAFASDNGLRLLTLGDHPQSKAFSTRPVSAKLLSLSADGTATLVAGGRRLGVCFLSGSPVPRHEK